MLALKPMKTQDLDLLVLLQLCSALLLRALGVFTRKLIEYKTN